MYYEYYENGQVYQSAEIYNGILNGKRVWYYLSGRIKQTGNYIDGKCDGDFISYYEDGKIKSITHYHNGTALGLKEFEVETSNKSKIFNSFSKQKNKNLNNKKKDVKNIESSTDKKSTVKVFTGIILLIGIILSIVYFKVLDKIDNKQIQSAKETVKTVKKAEKTVTNTAKEKITENKKLTKKTIENKKVEKTIPNISKEAVENKRIEKSIVNTSTEKISKNKEISKKTIENKKTKTVVTNNMKKDNFTKLSQILQKPKYKIYDLNIGIGYKISLPESMFINITQNKKDKSYKFSTKYEEITIRLKKYSLKNKSMEDYYKGEINTSLTNMNILNANISKDSYYINGRKNKTEIYKYAYYNKKNSEIILIDFYYPLSVEKSMKKVIKTTVKTLKKK